MKDILLDNMKNSKILIVDDLETNILLLKRIFEIDGYTNILGVDNSENILDIIIKEEPDLILLDLYMPKKSGLEILDELRECEEIDFIPVIMISAQNSKENIWSCLEKGAKDYITKPFDNIELLLKIRNTLETKLLHKIVQNDNKELDSRIKTRTRELEDLQYDLINKLLKAAEFRDNDTGEHIERIGKLSSIIGKAYGMDEEICNELMAASMMHDIGKIAIPDSILLKPSKLTKKEWEIMKTHALQGAEILNESKFSMMKMAESIARYHHEKWDGSGYPKGLKGEKIPIESRITAICDVYDALISTRIYKPAWSEEEALREIENESGKHFDPQLVEIFIRELPRIKEVYNG